nr:glycosyltransferase family 4 protein [Deinococcus geothermalis]
MNEVREIGNGIVNVAVDLACLQAALGHEVLVISSGGEYETLLAAHGVKHIAVNQSRRAGNIIRAIWAIERIFQEFRPNIVHAHMMTGAVISTLLKCRHSYMLVTTVHNEYQRSAVLMGLGDRVVAVSEAVGHAMRRRGIPGNRIRVVRNGTIGSPRRTPLPEVSPAELRRPAIVTVGAVSPRKGSDILIEAFSMTCEALPDAHLYFVGNRDWPEVEELVKQKNLEERVHFVGFEPQPQRYIMNSDVFVLPSLREPFGLVLIEAREVGIPIIASDVEGIPEALSGGKAGILIPPGAPVALSIELKRLLANNRSRKEWSRATQEGLEEFTAEQMNLRYMEVYEEVLSYNEKPSAD